MLRAPRVPPLASYWRRDSLERPTTQEARQAARNISWNRWPWPYDRRSPPWAPQSVNPAIWETETLPRVVTPSLPGLGRGARHFHAHLKSLSARLEVSNRGAPELVLLRLRVDPGRFVHVGQGPGILAKRQVGPRPRPQNRRRVGGRWLVGTAEIPLGLLRIPARPPGPAASRRGDGGSFRSPPRPGGSARSSDRSPGPAEPECGRRAR
jgi:hypothetical protein